MQRLREEEVVGGVLQEVARAVRNGGTVVFKTDTVYGLGASAFDEKACRRVYEIKGRPEYKPLCVLISDMTMLDELVEEVSEVERRLIDKFWPGALTLKMRKKPGVLPDVVSAGDEFVRVRLLENGFARRFVEALGVPIVAPSANLAGSATGVVVDDIIKELGDKVDYLIDGGDVESDITSTIVEVMDEKITIIREGRISKDEIIAVLEAEA